MKTTELVKIENHNGKTAVSLRELYLKLKLNPNNFHKWVNRNIINNPFAEKDKDYLLSFPMEGLTKKGKPPREIIITTDFAKKLLMQVKTETGEKIRNYFIQIEKISPAKSINEQTLQQLQTLQNEVKQVKAMLDPDNFTIMGYAATLKKYVTQPEAIRLGRIATKLCRQQNIIFSKIHDPRYGYLNIYPSYILETVFNEWMNQARF